MKYLVLFAYLLSQTSNLMACDFKLLGFAKLPDTPVLVKISDGKQERYVADDDGFMIISMAAAECLSVHPPPEIKLSQQQIQCVSASYKTNDITLKDQLNFSVDLSEDRKKSKALAALEKDCDLNQQRLWDTAYHWYRQAPLMCGKEMKSVVSAAVSQSVLFYYNTLTLQQQGKLTGTKEDQKKYIEEVQAAMEYTQQFWKLIESNKTTVWDFEKWLKGLEPRAIEKGYNVFTKIDETRGTKNNYSLIDILKDMNSPFDFVKKQNSCSVPFAKGTIATLVGVVWPSAKDSKLGVDKVNPEVTK